MDGENLEASKEHLNCSGKKTWSKENLETWRQWEVGNCERKIWTWTAEEEKHDELQWLDRNAVYQRSWRKWSKKEETAVGKILKEDMQEETAVGKISGDLNCSGWIGLWDRGQNAVDK
jgi:hypothetical protein